MPRATWSRSRCLRGASPRPTRCRPRCRPPGNRLTAAERLAAGHATGALRLAASDEAAGAWVRCTVRGRALVAACDYKKGAVVALAPGKLYEGLKPPASATQRESYQLRPPRDRKRGAWLLLHTPTPGALGNMVNTAGKLGGRNNAKLVPNPARKRLAVVAQRNIRRGEEVLAAYGASYTRQLNKAACANAVAPRFGWVKCPACGLRVQARLLSKHRANFRCARKTLQLTHRGRAGAQAP